MESKYLQVAKKHGTDKVTHGYMEFYEKIIVTPPKKMLEIGVFKGASIKMWKELFPMVELHVVDLFKDPDNISEKKAQELGAITHKGDQGDKHFLSHIGTEFDLIIDDGSHNAHHQWISLSALFGPSLTCGGIYVIEDLHCNLDQFYYDGRVVQSYEETILYAAKKNRLENHWYFDWNFAVSEKRKVELDFSEKIIAITKTC